MRTGLPAASSMRSSGSSRNSPKLKMRALNPFSFSFLYDDLDQHTTAFAASRRKLSTRAANGGRPMTLLAEVIESHGGAELWRRIRHLSNPGEWLHRRDFENVVGRLPGGRVSTGLI